MDSEKGVNIHLPENYNGQPVEVVIRHGEATELLSPKEAVTIGIIGTIDAPLRWLQKRVDQTEQIEQKRCHVLVNRDRLSIFLITQEKEEERTTVCGRLEIDPIFEEFGINTTKTWTPVKLGEFFKMNRAYFPDRGTNMTLVSSLKHFVAKVNSNLEKKLEQNGSKSEAFSQEVNSNLPAAFELSIPIFKGQLRQTIEVEVYAVIDGQSVYLSLVSPGAKEFITNQRDESIDTVLRGIEDVAPDIVIIEQ